MIQKFPQHQEWRSQQFDEAKSLTSRIDPARFALPTPHFDISSTRQFVDFLNVANASFNTSNAPDQLFSVRLKQLYAVTQLSRTVQTANWPSRIEVCRSHPLFQTLHQDPFVKRAFDKPRGYPGDAVLLDYIYDQEMSRPTADMSPVGERIHRWTTQSSACNGVKARRAFIADWIDKLAIAKTGVEIMSVACGHFREADISSAMLRRKLKRIVAVDSDAESLAVVQRDYGRLGIETIPIQARQMVTGRIDFGKFDFIFSAGLFDYLTDQNCRLLCTKWFSMLKPGGFLLLTNFFEDIEGVGFMEAFMDWNLIFRNRFQMMETTRDVPEDEIEEIHYFAEENRNVIFIMLQKAW